MSPVQRVIAEAEQHEATKDERREGTQELREESESGDDSDDDMGCNIELNFGRPARPEECLEDDEVLCLLVTKGRGRERLIGS